MPLSARNRRWDTRDPASAEFIAASGEDPLIATLLYQREIRDPAEIAAFLDTSMKTGLHDAFLMKGMPEASARIARAIRDQESMAVYGDFDTDGVTAVTLLMQAITAMGGNIRPYIPHRMREGYGLNSEAIEQLAVEGVRLLITVDCGISNVAEVDRANALGIDVIVTDHHHPPAELPRALAVVNPKQAGCEYPYKQLVGVGIAYKLVNAIRKQGIAPGSLRGRDMLDVVALGTVTDMGPLNGENRALVRAGLQAINTTERPGLRALIAVSGLTPGQIDSTAIGFMLGPRINAAGRLDDAVRAYDLLLATDLASARQIAEELNTANRNRQQLTKEVQAAARAQAEAAGRHQRRVVLIDGEGFPSGVVGLVAGKLVEEWGRPVLLIERGSETSRGSARSIAGFSIIEALTECKDLFVKFGGHSAAAGFTLATDQIPELDRRLQAIADQRLTDEMLEPALNIDLELALTELNRERFQQIERLQPFGQANPMPTLMTRRVQVLSSRARGNEGQHLALKLAGPAGKPIDGIAFRLGRFAESVMRHPWIDIAYTLEENTWNGQTSLRLNIKDFRRAT
jgi:single-stranded-DNA-specific exonuclease